MNHSQMSAKIYELYNQFSFFFLGVNSRAELVPYLRDIARNWLGDNFYIRRPYLFLASFFSLQWQKY